MARQPRTWTLIGADDRPYESDCPGILGGNRGSRIYGRLDCPSALRAIAPGGYVANRVFYRDEATAVAAGYRPCGRCLAARYAAWRSTPAAFARSREERLVSKNDDARVDRLLNQLDTAWTAFQEAYASLSDDQLMIPGVTGAWSVRDLVAHVTWWDEEAIKHLPLILEGGRAARYSVTYGGIEAFNAMMTERKRNLSLAEVREEFEATHRRLVDYLLSLPPDKLLANPRFRRRLKLDTFGHYTIHTADIRAWRAERGL